MDIYTDKKPDNALEIGDVFRCNSLDIHDYVYVVIDAKYGGGGHGHGPHDVYPHGWIVTYQVLSNDALHNKGNSHRVEKGENKTFSMSGSFNNYVSPDKINKIGRMRKVTEFVWM